MVLNNFFLKTINWDRASRKLKFEKIRTAFNDSNGCRLEVEITNGGLVEDLTNMTLNLYWGTSNEARKGLDQFNATDLGNGEFEICYTTGMLSNIDTLTTYLQLVSSSGIIISEGFSIKVFKGIDDNNFLVLTNALVEVSGWNERIDVVEQNYADRAAALEETYSPNLTKVTEQLAQKVGLGTKAEMEDLSDEVISAVTGGTTVNVLSEPADYSVSPIKTNFITQGLGLANIYDSNESTNGYYIGTDGVTLTAGANYGYSGYMDVIAGETVILADNNPSILAFFYGDSFNYISRYIGKSDDYVATPLEITIPNGVTKMRINYHLTAFTKETYTVMANRYASTIEIPSLRLTEENVSNTLLGLVTTENNGLMSSADKSKIDGLEISTWTNKKITFIGDSITDTITPGKKYLYFIQDKINCVIENNGKSGTRYLAGTNIISRMDALSNDSDLILFFAGVNDYLHMSATPMGQLGDTTTATYYGALDVAFSKAIVKWSLKTIAVITPLPKQNGKNPNYGGYKLENYVNAIMAVAKKYSLPILDLYHESSYFPDNAIFRVTYTYEGDGLHPTEEWHEMFLARKTLSFMNRL